MDSRSDTPVRKSTFAQFFACGLYKVTCISIFVVIFAVFLGYYVYAPAAFFTNLKFLFFGDNSKLTCFNIDGKCIDRLNIDENFSKYDVTLQCRFKPITMKFEEPTEVHVTMTGLLKWQKPHETSITLKASEFMPLIPSYDKGVGDVWYIIEPANYHDGRGEMDDLRMRYRDDTPPDNTPSSLLYRILSMFHENIFLQTRFAPRGTLAVIRAKNPDFLDIVFRCHAEFQINNPPLLPFWFTPAQFQGRLVLKRESSEIINFTLSVPTHRKLNVDMEWIENLNENMVVDIGFIPQMLIHNTDIGNQQHLSWNEEISLQEAYDVLEQKMLPFKEVSYKPITEVLNELSGQSKLLHCIVLWGALDDQSC